MLLAACAPGRTLGDAGEDALDLPDKDVLSSRLDMARASLDLTTCGQLDEACCGDWCEDGYRCMVTTQTHRVCMKTFDYCGAAGQHCCSDSATLGCVVGTTLVRQNSCVCE